MFRTGLVSPKKKCETEAMKYVLKTSKTQKEALG